MRVIPALLLCINMCSALPALLAAQKANSSGRSGVAQTSDLHLDLARNSNRELWRETAALHAAEFRRFEPLLKQPNMTTRLAAIEILGVMGVTESAVSSILAAQLSSPSREIKSAALSSLLIMRHNAADAGPSLLRVAKGTDQKMRWRALDVIDESQAVDNIVDQLVPFLQDADPTVRQSTAYALDAVAPQHRDAVLTALTPLLQDQDSDVRDAAESTVRVLRDHRAESVGACIHRFGRDVRPMTLEVLASYSVSATGGTKFRNGSNGMRINSAAAFNLTRDSDSSGLAVNLSNPANPAASRLGSIAVKEFHIFYLFDANHLIWNFREMLPGTSVASPRAEFVLREGPKTYRLQFGPWGLGDCGEPYAHKGRIHGAETTPVQLTRVTDTLYDASLADTGLGRLWDWTDPANPVDLGLYKVSFHFRMTMP